MSRPSNRSGWSVWAVVVGVGVLASLGSGQVDWECVPVCKCLWVSGKKTAECKRQNLVEVPRGLSSQVQHLDLAGNQLAYLGERAFTGVQLDNLQKLVVRECGLKGVDAGAFAGLRIVIEIDLSGNRIRQLHRGTFDQTERLRVLLLNGNLLQRLDDGLFHDLHYLQKVELSDNRLAHVGQWTFRSLPGLQSLALDGNNLTRLDVRSFDSLPKLGSLELRRNPWHCDCHLRPFRDWAIQRKLYTRPTACASPASLEARPWDELGPEQLACAPRITQLGYQQRGELGSGASARLWCHASAEPAAQIAWLHRQRQLANATKRPGSERHYVLQRGPHWANLTIPELALADRGEYVCVASNFGGSVEANLTLHVLADGAGPRSGLVGLPLALGLALLALLALVLALALCLCGYCRKRRGRHDEKSAEAASLDHHGLGEQEKSLITAINPVVKPPRRYEAPSLTTSHGTEMTELNRTLLDTDSVFADGVGSVVGVLPNGLNEEERHGGRVTPDLDSVLANLGGGGGGGGSGLSSPAAGVLGMAGMSQLHGGSVISGLGTLSRNTTPYRQYPPDLLAFSAGRNSSPTSQASTAPDSSRLPPASPGYSSAAAAAAAAAAAFKTLPHPQRAASATPYSLPNYHPSLPRLGYMTMPRRPRAPSWSSCPPTSPTERDMPAEPVYDNLGKRTTADGSSKLSLNKSAGEPGLLPASMRNRPLPSTPGSGNGLTLPRAPRSSKPLHLAALQLNRSAPEGAPEWPVSSADGEPLPPIQPAATAAAADDNKPRKVPPRPPPKPKNKNAAGPLYEDEGEDGTEV